MPGGTRWNFGGDVAAWCDLIAAAAGLPAQLAGHQGAAAWRAASPVTAGEEAAAGTAGPEVTEPEGTR